MRDLRNLVVIGGAWLMVACSGGKENVYGPSAAAGGTGGTAGEAGSEAGGAAGSSGSIAGNAGAGTTGGTDAMSDPMDSGMAGGHCPPPPACDALPPDPGALVAWNRIESGFTASSAANHRGRDLFLNPNDPQWLMGKFSYGSADDDLQGEAVDIWLLRDCGSTWEKLASMITTDDDMHEAVEGVNDSGGRVYFEIPADKRLGPGRHRAHMVVRGDATAADLFIEIVPQDTPMFVTDVDGTLTATETAEFDTLLVGTLPDPQVDAASALQILRGKGFLPFYLTARPEWLTGRTREFLFAHGFPPGIIHTTVNSNGATGDPAVTFKTDELAALKKRGLFPTYAIGNLGTDAEAYDNARVEPLDHRLYFQFDDTNGGRRFEQYAELLAELEALPSSCP